MKLAKPELSSIEVHALVKELSEVKKAKVDQIYQVSERAFIFQLYSSGKGKSLLYISDRVTYITKIKPLMAEPSSFCMQLRKELSGMIIDNIRQIDAQRIVEITLGDYKLLIELFSKGNIILCHENKIIGLLEHQSWQSRELKPKVEYKVPPMGNNIFDLSKADFFKIISNSKKDKLVTCLATELGLGGIYAEEVCSRACIDKNAVPKASDELWAAFKNMIDENPKGYIYEGNLISPIKLNLPVLEKFDSFNEVLANYLSKSKLEQEKEAKEQQYKQKLNSLQRILEHQQEKLKELDSAVVNESEKGDFIYHNYQAIKKLLDYVEKYRHEGGWDQVREELAKLKKIKKIDLKNKKIVVEL